MFKSYAKNAAFALLGAGDEEIRVRANPECDFEIGATVNITLPPEKCVGLAEAGEIAD
jgi:hypothetical protein